MVTRGERVVATLDVGSSKVAALIAQVGGDEGVRVLGFGQRACSGVRRGLVADMERTEAAIRTAVDQAESQANVRAEKVFVNLSAGGLDSHVAAVEVEIGGRAIGRPDIEQVLAAGRSALEAGPRTILHAQPALYTLDGVTGVRNPLGFYADRLGVDIHVISADTPPIRNLDLSVRNAHLGVHTIVASAVAAGLSCLALEERDLGVAVVEIGAGVTNVAVHASGMLVGLASIPMGGKDITDDIASAFATGRKHAERLKTLHGSAVMSPKDNHSLIEIMPINEDDGADPGRATRAQLVSVIRDRLDRLFVEVSRAMTALGFTGPGGRQVVLTGGTAELRSIADYAQTVLDRPVRVGRPRALGVGRPELAGPAYSSLVGLALYASEDTQDVLNLQVQPERYARGGSGRSSWARMAALLKASL
jgi:cell division protein FtsA